MATTIRQSKLYDGLVANEDVVDLNFEDPTLPGSVIIVLYWMETTMGSNMEPWQFSGPEDVVEGANIYFGWGISSGQDRLGYHGQMFFGPSQPSLPDYLKLTASVYEPDPVALKAVAYEVSSDLGPIVPYGSYDFRGVNAYEDLSVYDWVAVYSGYNKPRPVMAITINPTPGAMAPLADGLGTYGTAESGIDNVKIRLDDVTWAPGESHHFHMDTEGFVAYFSGVVEQSQYETIQHIEKSGVDHITPATDGVAVTDKSLLLLSARYKDFSDFALEGWNPLSVQLDDGDRLATVVWWKQATNSEPATYTAPGMPLNLNLREVGGFPDQVRLAVSTFFNGSADPPSPMTAEWIRLNSGVVQNLPDFPDNDAYFFSAISWENEQEFTFSLPDPRTHLNKALLDTGDGWDFFPDGYGADAAIIATGFPDGGNVGSYSGGIPMAGVGAIFFNAPAVTHDAGPTKWTRTMEPNLNWIAKHLLAGMTRLQNYVDEQIQANGSLFAVGEWVTVSELENGWQWIDELFGPTGNPPFRYRKSPASNQIQVQFSVIGGDINQRIFQLPSEYAPSYNVETVCEMKRIGDGGFATVEIGVDGSVNVRKVFVVSPEGDPQISVPIPGEYAVFGNISFPMNV